VEETAPPPPLPEEKPLTPPPEPVKVESPQPPQMTAKQMEDEVEALALENKMRELAEARTNLKQLI